MAPRPRVMIVDDDADLAELLEAALEDEYEPISVYNGVDALARAGEYQPDAFIIDIMMPVMSGWEVIEHLRADARHRGKPIIVLTAKDQREDMKRGYTLGANLYLTKPVSIERLLKNLELFRRQGELQCAAKALAIDQVHEAEMRRRMGVLAGPSDAPSSGPGPSAKPATARQPARNDSEPPERLDVFSMIDEDIARVDRAAGAQGALDAQSEEEMALLAAAARAAGRALPRILVADDDQEVLDMVRGLFGETTELIETRDGIEAMRKAGLYKPDLFIIDGMMPRMTGFQMCDAIHSSADLRNTPIIFMSAKSTPKDRRYIKTLRVSCFLAKPFAPTELERAVYAVIRAENFKMRTDRPTWKEVLLAEREEVHKLALRHHAGGGGELGQVRQVFAQLIQAGGEQPKKPAR